MASPRIEILFIIDYFHRTGGTEKHLAQLIAGLPADEFRCSVVAFDLGENPLLDDLRQRGVAIISLPVGREYSPEAAVQAWRLSRLIRNNHYDIVQTFHQKADTYGALVARLSGAQHIVSSKRDTGQLRRAWHLIVNRRLKSVFDAVIVVADAVRVSAISNDHLPESGIVVIYNGVDTGQFTVPTVDQRRDARARLGFAPDDFVVGMVARFRQEKNHDVFFEALLRVLPSIPALKVLALGDGPLLNGIQEELTRTDLADRTVFTGDAANVVPYLWAMDIGVLTSGSEGFSNAVLEQMAVGLPMIVTDVGGNSEAVKNGENGIVIPPGNSRALAEAVMELYADRFRREAMGRESRRRVLTRFTVERMCCNHAKLYRSLVDSRRQW